MYLKILCHVCLDTLPCMFRYLAMYVNILKNANKHTQNVNKHIQNADKVTFLRNLYKQSASE